MAPNVPPDYHGSNIPPEIYDIAFGWDPQPEIDRLVFLARQAGVEPRSALELGCGTGRLLGALGSRLPDRAGIELDPQTARFARDRAGVNVVIGDMSDFALGRTFELIFSSANTIRHVCGDDAIASLWCCVAGHLSPGGVFVFDLELGLAYERSKVGRPACWILERGETTVHVSWTVTQPPAPSTRCSLVEWVFQARGGPAPGIWRQTFPLRTYDAAEFVGLATAGGQLRLHAIYELRDPYLFELPVERAEGRMLVVLQRR